MLFEYLFELRRGIPQLAWGQDLSFKYERALFCEQARKGSRPLTRFFTIDLARRNPRYWENYTYHAERRNRLKWHDPSWIYLRELENQIHPHLRSLHDRITIKHEPRPAAIEEDQFRRRRSLSPPPIEGRTHRAVRSRSPLPDSTRHLDTMDLDYEVDFEDTRYNRSRSRSSAAMTTSNIQRPAKSSQTENRSSSYNSGFAGLKSVVLLPTSQNANRLAWNSSTITSRQPLSTRTNAYR